MTTRPDFRTRDTDAPQWWHDMRELERTVMLAAMILVIVSTALYGLAKSITVVDDFAANVITEVVGVAVTVMILMRFIRQETTRQRKEELILQLGSTDHALTHAAVRALEYYGWLQDGTLNGAILRKATLQSVELYSAVLIKANLEQANLAGARLISVDLREALLNYANLEEIYLSGNLEEAELLGVTLNKADMRGVNLKHADMVAASLKGTRLAHANLYWVDLWKANLTGASLHGTNLERAHMSSVNMENTHLVETNLKGAGLKNASLKGATGIHRAVFDEDTILPDGTNWTPDIDMKKFTRPDHPDFWEPEWVQQAREADSE